MASSFHLDAPSLQLLIVIIGFLLLASIIRMLLLSRNNRQLKHAFSKMEKTSLEQQAEIADAHHDNRAWREGMQRQFDVLRAELSERLQQSEMSNSYLQQQFDTELAEKLCSLQEKITALKNSKAAAAPRPQPQSPSSSAPTIPSMPSIETMHLQSLESDLASAHTELASLRQRNAHLQSCLHLARRRQAPSRRQEPPRQPR